MLTKLLSTGLINILATLSQLGVIVWLGRLLSDDHYGQVHLLISTIAVLSTVSLAGQNNSATRFLAAKNQETAFRWQRYAARVGLVSSLMTLLGGACLALSSQYEATQIGIAMICGISFCLAQFLAAGILRAYGRTALALALNHGWALLSLILVAIFQPRTAPDFFVLLAISHLTSVLTSLVVCLKKIPNGEAEVSSQVWSEGFWFWLISASMILGRHLDRILLAAFVPFAVLGGYGAVVTLMGGFDVLMGTVGFLLLPTFAQTDDVQLRKRIAEVGLLILGAVGFYWLLGEGLLDLLFAGRYNDSKNLIPILLLAGVAKVAYAIPASLLGGRLEAAALKRFALGNLVLIVLTVGATWLMAQHFGILGVAWATVVVWTARVLWGVVIIQWPLTPPATDT